MSVKRNTAYNLLGSVVPLALALVTVPLYLRLVGPERYGVLSIAWLFLGYFGLFDLGLGRATAFRIAALRDATPEQRSTTFWSALATNCAMGLVGGLVLWAAAAYFYGYVIKVDEALRPEIMAAVPVLAASVPVATINGVFASALQGRERFAETNVISASSTALFHALPLAVATFLGPNLLWLLSAAMAARVVAGIALGAQCLKHFGGKGITFDRKELTSLLKYGGWVNLTSIFGPILVFVDRFAIGSLLGAGAVAIYSVPYQLTRVVAVMPAALVNALFPRMSAADTNERDGMTAVATKMLALLITPAVLGGIYGLGLFLNLWMGGEIAEAATPIGRVLLVGFWVNAFALVPFTKLQASGRPDLVTKVLLAEIPIYLAALYFGLKEFGLLGCAVVFAGRCLLDYVLLSRVARRPLEETWALALNVALLAVAVGAATLFRLNQWEWWAAAAVNLGAVLVLNWRALPHDSKHDVLTSLKLKRLRLG